jgi:drug/metabolite transporter (DMT)-like permease
MNRHAGAYFELTAAMMIVGSTVVVGKLLVAAFPIFLIGGLRFAVACAVLVPWLVFAEGGFPRVARRDLVLLSLVALFGIFGFAVLLLYGLRYTSAAESGIITSTTPAVIGVISYVFLKERLGPLKSGAIALAAGGLLAIGLMDGGGSQGPNPLLGNLLVFGAVIGEALFTILAKLVAARVSPLGIATLTSLFGLAWFLPFALYEAVGFDWASARAADWGLILYYAIGLTVISYVLWYRGIAKVPASTAGVFTGLMPVSAVLLSYALLGEGVRWGHPVGIICVLAAILLIARADSRWEKRLRKETAPND